MTFSSFLTIVALSLAVMLHYRIAYYGLYTAPTGRLFTVIRVILSPIRAVALWNPVTPRTQERVTGLLVSGHRWPKRSSRLLSRTEPLILSQTVTYWNQDPLSDVMAQQLYWLLKDLKSDWTLIEKVIRNLVKTPELLLDLATTELGIPSPGSEQEALAYAVSQAKALDLVVLTDMKAGMGLLIVSFSSSNMQQPDPIRKLWPDEDRADLNHVLYFMRQLGTQETKFGEMLEELQRCIPTTRPGWVSISLPYLRELSLAQTVRFPDDGFKQLHEHTTLLRDRADCITEAAALRRAGAPGDFDQLIEVIDAIGL